MAQVSVLMEHDIMGSILLQVEEQTKLSHKIAHFALQSNKSSTKILDLIQDLRLASLNIFIKTERAVDSVDNIFAPISHEFMNLVKSYDSYTREFGDIAIGFVTKVVTYAKNIRKYRLLILGLNELLLNWKLSSISQKQRNEIMKTMMTGGAIAMDVHPQLRKHLISASVILKEKKEELYLNYQDIKRTYNSLRVIDKNLSNLSNIGEFATQLAKTEAARLEHREDLVASFEEIHTLLNRGLQELEEMRNHFSLADRSIQALSWEM